MTLRRYAPRLRHSLRTIGLAQRRLSVRSRRDEAAALNSSCHAHLRLVGNRSWCCVIAYGVFLYSPLCGGRRGVLRLQAG